MGHYPRQDAIIFAYRMFLSHIKLTCRWFMFVSIYCGFDFAVMFFHQLNDSNALCELAPLFNSDLELCNFSCNMHKEAKGLYCDEDNGCGFSRFYAVPGILLKLLPPSHYDETRFLECAKLASVAEFSNFINWNETHTYNRMFINALNEFCKCCI